MQEITDIIQASNTLPQIKEKRRAKQYSSPALSPSQKRKETALKGRYTRRLSLQARLLSLRQAKRLHFSHQMTDGQLQSVIKAEATTLPVVGQPLLNDGIPQQLIDQIYQVKAQIYQVEKFIKKYEANPCTYRSGHFKTGQKTDDKYLYLSGLFLHEFSKNKSFEKLLEKKGVLPNYYHRMKWLSNELNTVNNEIYLSAFDAKWLINKLKKVTQKLERERSINYTLFKEFAPHLQNDNYFRESKSKPVRHRKKGGHILSHDNLEEGVSGIHAKKFNTLDLEEITSIRPMQRLIDFWGCQLREDERDRLIKINNEIVEMLEGKYTVKL